MQIYHYEDYREYLRQLYEAEKEKPHFSTRSFATAVGFSNPGYIGDVLKEKRRLSTDACEKLSRYFKLNKAEKEYWLLLIQYAHAKKSETKEQLYQELHKRRSRSQFARLEGEQVGYFSDYRYPLLRTALMATPFYGDYEKLAQQLQFSIPVADIKRLIRNLCQWNILSQDSSGLYSVSERYIEPDARLGGQIRKLHKDWLSLAESALFEIPKEDRHISSMLVAVSKETERKMHQEIEEFRSKMWDLVNKDTEKAEELIQLNIQSFSHFRKSGTK